MTLKDIPQIQTLTKEEKLLLVEALWDSIAEMPDDLLVTDKEKALLDERLKAHLLAPEAALSLEEFNRRLDATL